MRASRIAVSLRAKAALLVGAVLALSSRAYACPGCGTREKVWSEVLAHGPLRTAGILIGAFTLEAVLIALTARAMRRSRLLFGGALLLGADSAPSSTESSSTKCSSGTR